MQPNIPRRAGRAPAAAICAMSVLLAGHLPAMGQGIPTDAKATSPATNCVVSPTLFKSWFVGGQPKLNGAVLPANSVTFSDTPNCSFYQWSAQMFLWVTLAAPTPDSRWSLGIGVKS